MEPKFPRCFTLSELDDESLQNALKGLYSRIHEKNELITMWRANLPTGIPLSITDGKGSNPIEITTTIGELTIMIRDLTEKVLPDLEKQYLRLSDP